MYRSVISTRSLSGKLIALVPQSNTESGGETCAFKKKKSQIKGCLLLPATACENTSSFYLSGLTQAGEAGEAVVADVKRNAWSRHSAFMCLCLLMLLWKKEEKKRK